MATRMRRLVTVVVLLAVSGCATMPSGPSVMVLPAPDKTFEQFQFDDVICRQWAGQQIGMTPQQIANQNTISGAAIGTVIGAALGAAIGAASGDPGTGAAIGAAGGLALGTASGSDAGQISGREGQRRYDIAYQQCMYAKGNQLPGTTVTRTRRVQTPPPPPPPPVPLGPGPTQPGIPPDYTGR
jgi:hypothetical protein